MTDVLRLLAGRDNMALLSALAAGPSYPRLLAKRLGRSETHVAHRLRTLERGALVEGNWSRKDGKNVRLYHLKLHRLELVIEERGWQIGVLDDVSETPHSSRSQIPARCSFYGRKAELQSLSDPLTPFAIVLGLPGIGKTSLATELAHRYGKDHVFWHSIKPSETASGFLTAAADWCNGSGAGMKTLEPAPMLREVTRRLGSERALVVLDDYHNAHDNGIHEIVRSWQRARGSGRVVVLSRTRPPLDQMPGTQVMTLSGLSPEASRAILRSRGIKMSADDGRHVLRSCRGHPLALLLAGPRLRLGEGGSGMMLEALGRHAAEALDTPSREVLLSLAAVRRPLDTAGIRLLSGVYDPTFPLVLLERRGLVRSAGHLYEAHDILREALAPVLASRPEIHRRASEMFRRSERPEDALDTIYHALQAGDVQEAMDLLESEVLHDRHRLVNRISIASYLEVIDAIPIDRLSPRQKFLVHLSRGALLYEVAKTTSAIGEYERALRIAESADEPLLLASVLAPLGDLLAYGGRMADAERLLLRNLRVVEAEGWADRRARALLLLNRFFGRKGDLARSREYGELALREARRLGDRDLLVDLETYHIPWAFYRPGAERRIRGELARARRHHNPILLDYCREFLGELLARRARTMDRGRAAEARRAMKYLNAAASNRETLQMGWSTAYVRSWRAEALRLAGETEKAESEARSVVATEREFGVNHCLILGHDVLAHIFAGRGQISAAWKHARRALSVAERLGCGCVGVARLELALQDAASGRVEEARARWRQALKEIQRRGYPDEFEYGLQEGKRRGWRVATRRSVRPTDSRPQRRPVAASVSSFTGSGEWDQDRPA